MYSMRGLDNSLPASSSSTSSQTITQHRRKEVSSEQLQAFKAAAVALTRLYKAAGAQADDEDGPVQRAFRTAAIEVTQLYKVVAEASTSSTSSVPVSVSGDVQPDITTEDVNSGLESTLREEGSRESQTEPKNEVAMRSDDDENDGDGENESESQRSHSPSVTDAQPLDLDLESVTPVSCTTTTSPPQRSIPPAKLHQARSTKLGPENRTKHTTKSAGAKRKAFLQQFWDASGAEPDMSPHSRKRQRTS